MPWIKFLLGGLLLLLGAARAPAQTIDPPPIQAVALRSGERVVLDGRLDHPAWARAPAFDAFVARAPVLGAVPAHRTEVRVLFDEHALYVGLNALDPEPERIRAPLVRHDGVNRTQDFIAVYLDAVGARQSAQFFRVSAAGSTADGMHTHADDSEDFAPDFDFDAAAARHEGGWSAVMRIPFASLRFGSGPQAVWRMMVVRRVPREQFHMNTSVPILREAPSFIAAMQPLQGLQPPVDHGWLSLRPSLTLRSEHRRGGDGPRRQEHQTLASLDLKWRPRAELVVDATLNPDFSQVALDVPQLRGNTLFALELAEKRPFFFESSDLLRAPSGGLYTRSFTEPRLGARATWRARGLAGTAFVVDDRGGGLTLLPGTYATAAVEQPESHTVAARLRGDAGALQWGALAVQRDYRGPTGQRLGHNQVAGPDLAWQIDPVWRVKAQWLGSDTTARSDGNALVRGPAQQGQRRYLGLTRQVPDAQTDLVLDDIGAGFRHDSGFVVQNGQRSVSLHHGTGWFDVAPLNELWFNLDAYQARQAGSGQRVTEYLTPGVWMSGPHNSELDIQWRGYSRQRGSEAGPLLAERYVRIYAAATPAPWWPLAEATLNLGRLADLPAQRVRHGGRANLALRLRPLSRLEFEPSLSAAWLREAGDTVYDEAASQLLAVWHLDARRSLRAIAQRASSVRDGTRQFADGSLSFTFAWRPTAGSVLYVGTSRARSGEAPQRSREAFVKLQLDVDDWRSGAIRW